MNLVCTQKYGPRHAYCPPRGHDTARTESLKVTAHYLGCSLRTISTHNILTTLKHPCISCFLISPALYHNTLGNGIFWGSLTFNIRVHDIVRTDCTLVVLPTYFVLFSYFRIGWDSSDLNRYVANTKLHWEYSSSFHGSVTLCLPSSPGVLCQPTRAKFVASSTCVNGMVR